MMDTICFCVLSLFGLIILRYGYFFDQTICTRMAPVMKKNNYEEAIINYSTDVLFKALRIGSL